MTQVRLDKKMTFVLKHKYTVAILIMMILSIVFGIMTRLSYIDNTDLKEISIKNDYQLSLDEGTFANIYFDNNLRELDHYQQKADAIVKVKLLDERTYKSQSTLSKVIIEESFKNSTLKKGQSIFVYEPSFFLLDRYQSLAGYNIMEKGTSYILFLEKLKAPVDYNFSKREKISFKPISTYYSKFPLKEMGKKTDILPNKEFRYSDIKSYEILTKDKVILNNYIKLKTSVINNYKRI
ncbi:hypothetical protein [Bacillus sp. UNCCL81]|uniref:hypothetical protein n=1 Tax=Bacillus sp. UNCCL81 TaxID=1502755 RepID=UPI0008E93AC6|nr:hypothetical protein [Bacillus sp. UNCCL81]SFC42511.1 hypothetical protein SAMN02799633_00763 [Bacillus sp. UNCCL81]